MKRYVEKMAGMFESDDGPWVKHQDLEAELATLRAALAVKEAALQRVGRELARQSEALFAARTHQPKCECGSLDPCPKHDVALASTGEP